MLRSGTGCGWCRKQLIQLTETVQEIPPDPERLEEWLAANSPAKRAYALGRQQHIDEGHGTPPSPGKADLPDR